MEKDSKRQYRRIDKALNELEKNLNDKKRQDFKLVYSILNFILKEYCQTCDGLQILANSDFKDSLLIILSQNPVPIEMATILLSILNNCYHNMDLFKELLISPVIDVVINQFLLLHQLYYRSLRFLTLCLNCHSKIILLPDDRIKELWKYCVDISKKITPNEKTEEISSYCITIKMVQQFTDFYLKYINQDNELCNIHNKDNFIQIIKDVFELSYKSNDFKLINGQRVSIILRFGKTYCDTPAYETLLSCSIKWLCSRKTNDSIKQLLSIYHNVDISRICYIHEEIRNEMFYHILSCSKLSNFHLSVLKIFYYMCSQGSYRIYLVDDKFCDTLLTYLSTMLICSTSESVLAHLTIIDIFLTFNPKQNLHNLVIKNGLVKSIISFMNNLLKDARIMSKIKSSVPKLFYLLEKSTNPERTDLNCESFEILVEFLKTFNSINCLNFLLSVSLTAPYTHLCCEGFVSLIFYELQCHKLDRMQLCFSHSPLKSVPRSFKCINKLHECGWLLISNVANGLPKKNILPSNLLSFEKYLKMTPDLILLIRSPSLATEFHYVLCCDIDTIKMSSSCDIKQLIMNICQIMKWQKMFSLSDSDITEERDSCSHKDTILFSNGTTSINVNKDNLFHSSNVFIAMFKHDFIETETNQIKFPYLSNKSILCLANMIENKKVHFTNENNEGNNVENCFSFEILLELIPVVTMFEINHVLRFIECYFDSIKKYPKNIVTEIIKLVYTYNSPSWLLFVTNSLKYKSLELFDDSVLLAILQELIAIFSDLLIDFSI